MTGRAETEKKCGAEALQEYRYRKNRYPCGERFTQEYLFSVFDVDFDVFSTFLIYRRYNQYFAEEKIKTLTPNIPVYIIKRMYRYKLIMDQGRDL